MSEEISLDTLQKIADQGSPMTLYEMAEAMYKAINERIVPALVEKGIKKYPNRTFFIQVETSADPVLRKGLPVPKVVADCRLSMPLPNYEQQVYKYHNGELKPLWIIPDANTCAQYRVEALNLHHNERLSLEWINNYYDGTYTRASHDYNKKLKV